MGFVVIIIKDANHKNFKKMRTIRLYFAALLYSFLLRLTLEHNLTLPKNHSFPNQWGSPTRITIHNASDVEWSFDSHGAEKIRIPFLQSARELREFVLNTSNGQVATGNDLTENDNITRQIKAVLPTNFEAVNLRITPDVPYEHLALLQTIHHDDGIPARVWIPTAPLKNKYLVTFRHTSPRTFSPFDGVSREVRDSVFLQTHVGKFYLWDIQPGEAVLFAGATLPHVVYDLKNFKEREVLILSLMENNTNDVFGEGNSSYKRNICNRNL